ncbi:hypothetical protein AcV7_005603 [Taiwanofungus camphoratus]|nr:hypothetical protein AcV7_005603 [Antrodia cinnamomea]
MSFTDSEIIATFQSAFVTTSCQVAAAGATVLLFLNRYILFAYGLIELLATFYWSTPLGCQAIFVLQDITALSIYAVIACFSALRVYGISGHRWIPAVVTLLLGLVPVATNIYQVARTSYASILYVNKTPECVSNDYFSHKTHFRCMISQLIQHSDLTSLVSLLLRDGTVYFVVLLVLNLLQVITEDVLKPVIKETADYLSIFVPAIESILISRFMMNLRQVYHTSDDDMPSLHLSSWHASSHHQPQSQTQSLEFTSRFVGNMGASLMHESSSMTVATSVDHL